MFLKFKSNDDLVRSCKTLFEKKIKRAPRRERSKGSSNSMVLTQAQTTKLQDALLREDVIAASDANRDALVNVMDVLVARCGVETFWADLPAMLPHGDSPEMSPAYDVILHVAKRHVATMLGTTGGAVAGPSATADGNQVIFDCSDVILGSSLFRGRGIV